jgi:16S rRNA (guanine1207-N2)-methyltransferase
MEHYFSKNPKSKFREEHFKAKLLGNEIDITSASSIFSVKEVDFGSKLLIENAKLPVEGSLLDLGCGYGVVGVAIKKARPDLQVVMSDVNDRATSYAEKNAKKNKTDCIVLKSDLFKNPDLDKMQFDTILTNPPFSAGKDLIIDFIKQSKEHLKHGGCLQLVAPHNKGGSSLKKIMEETFGNVDELVKKAGFRVYISCKV